MNSIRVFESNGEFCPAPRSGIRSVFIEGNMIIYGGYNKALNNSTYREIWLFNFYRNKWYKLLGMEKCPRSIASSSMVYYNGSLIIFGGCGFPFGSNCGGKLYVYNLFNGTWLELIDSKLDCLKPSPKYGHIMQTYKNKIFIHSGTKGREFLNELHSFSLRKFKWKEHRQKGRIPMPRYRHESVLYNNHFYIFGGGNNLVLFGFKTIHRLNLKTINWQELNCLPCPINGIFPVSRKAHSVDIHNGVVFMCGGLANGELPLKDVWKFSIINYQWTKLSIELPFALYFHTSSISPEGCIYIFGGVDSSENRTNKILKFWTCVPSLSELCWHMATKFRRHQLENSIIAPSFINRTFDWSVLFPFQISSP